MRALVLSLFLGADASLRLRNHVQNVLDAGGPAPPTNCTQHFFKEALLDHFDSVSKAPHWSQRFYVDDRFWCGAGCPIFLYIGGEGPLRAPSDRLFMVYLAEKMGALVLALEHRFYGDSRPTADMSVESLRYLSSGQALADLARFITYVSAYSPSTADTASSPPLKLQYAPSKSKWVTFGGSYPGALSAWFKLKYPSLVAGAISSSAPVHAQYNYLSYAEVVGTALAAESVGGSKDCFDTVVDGTTALMELVGGTNPPATDPRIPKELRPCKPDDKRFPAIGSKLDLAFYEASIYGPFQGTVQYNREEPHGATVATICAALTDRNVSSDALERLAAAQPLFAPPQPEPTDLCVDASFDEDFIDDISNVTWGEGANNAGRLWTWQSCNEFGYFQTTAPGAVRRGRAAAAQGAPRNPFAAFVDNGIDEAGAAVCRGAFGTTALPAIADTNTHYGGRDYGGTNVTLVNGNLDPWHALGVIADDDPYYESCLDERGEPIAAGSPGCAAQRTRPSTNVVLIDTTSHCGDMYTPGLFASKSYCPGPSCHDDPPSLVKAHAQIEHDVASYVSG